MAPLDGSAPFAEAALIGGGAVDPAQFKEVLARLAGGLAIVSGWEKGEPHGILVSSITGLSVDPPRFLFCVRQEAASHGAFLRNDLCGVSILSAEDDFEARAFIEARLRDQRFKGTRWSLAAPTPPLLQDSLASVVCVIDARIGAGSHTIFVATANSTRLNDGDPLLSFNRSIRMIA